VLDAYHNRDDIVKEFIGKQQKVNSHIDACKQTRQKYCLLEAQIEEEEKKIQRCIFVLSLDLLICYSSCTAFQMHSIHLYILITVLSISTENFDFDVHTLVIFFATSVLS
jgi:hypothetical protein